jgi:hypothetical protein
VAAHSWNEEGLPAKSAHFGHNRSHNFEDTARTTATDGDTDTPAHRDLAPKLDSLEARAYTFLKILEPVVRQELPHLRNARKLSDFG